MEFHQHGVANSFGLSSFCSHVNFKRAGCLAAHDFLEAFNRRAEPLPESGFQVLTSSEAVKRINGFALSIQRNVAAGDLSIPQVFGDELHQNTVTARLRWLSRIKIQARRRVLKDKLRPPSGPRGMAVTALFDK